MPFLYITEQGASLHKDGESVIVKKGDSTILKAECQNLDAILLFGNVQLTTQVFCEIFKHGIEVAFLSLDGKLRGRLTMPNAKNVLLRMAQYKRYEDTSFRLSNSKAIVGAKAENAKKVLLNYKLNHVEADLDDAIKELEVVSGKIATATDIESLLGFEGAIARIYFGAFPKLMKGDWEFTGRVFHPSTDPVNALLSFGYVLVSNELAWLLNAMGFDPYIGIYHSIDYGRQSLALDMLEEFRHPLVDRFVLKILNLRILTKENFESGDGGAVYLNRDGKKKFFVHYEKWMNQANVKTKEKECSFREIFRHQAEKLAKSITSGGIYEPYIYQR